MEQDIYGLIGKKIKYIRVLRKMSQEKLAELADLSTNYIGQIERAERKATIDVLYRISKALKIELYAFFSNIKLK